MSPPVLACSICLLLCIHVSWCGQAVMATCVWLVVHRTHAGIQTLVGRGNVQSICCCKCPGPEMDPVATGCACIVGYSEIWCAAVIQAMPLSAGSGGCKDLGGVPDGQRGERADSQVSTIAPFAGVVLAEMPGTGARSWQ